MGDEKNIEEYCIDQCATILDVTDRSISWGKRCVEQCIKALKGDR